MKKMFACFFIVMFSFILTAQGTDIDILITQLSDPSAEVREKASEKLAELGESAHPATDALIQALSDENYFVVRNSVEALGKIGHPAKSATPILIQLLSSKWDSGVHVQAVKALGKIGGDPQVIAPVLVTALMHNDFFIQMAAEESLLAMKEEALPLLIEKLAQPDTRIREASIQVLEKMETFAKPAVPALIQLLRDKKDYIHITSARALVKIGTESIPQMLELFVAGDFDRSDIVSRIILAKMDENIVVPVLAQNILHTNQNIRIGVLGALARIQSEKRLLAIPALLQAATTSDKVTRMWVAIVLKSYSSEALQSLDEKGISAIIQMYLLDDPQGYTIKNTEEILLKMGKVIAPELIKTYHAPTTTPDHKKAMEQIFSALQIKLVATEECQIESVLKLQSFTNVEPVYIGKSIYFIVEVTNEGTIEDNNVALTLEFSEELITMQVIENSSMSGVIRGQKAIFQPLATFSPNQKIKYSVEVYTMSLGNARVKITLSSDKQKSPVCQEKVVAIVKQKVVYEDDDDEDVPSDDDDE